MESHFNYSLVVPRHPTHTIDHIRSTASCFRLIDPLLENRFDALLVRTIDIIRHHPVEKSRQKRVSSSYHKNEQQTKPNQ